MNKKYLFILLFEMVALGTGIFSFSETKKFDHNLYGKVLEKYVKDAGVDYQNLKQDPLSLYKYLKKVKNLSLADLNSMSRDEKQAFYLNVYNALTLKAIIEHYPVKSIKSIAGVWDSLNFKVAGRDITLNYIEHDILRKRFREPRIHFGLVCASKSCPQLRSEPFLGKDIDKMLDEEAHRFINDKTKVRLDKKGGILYLSSIFKWFKDDFGDLEKFVVRYLPEEDKGFILQNKIRIRYLKYDWSLNEQ